MHELSMMSPVWSINHVPAGQRGSGIAGISRRVFTCARQLLTPPTLVCLLREVLSNFVDFFARRRPVGAASITVENQSIGFQGSLEFFLSERNGQIVVVRADGIELQAIAHKFPRGFQSILLLFGVV
jgi:hypothetical protein